MTLEYQTHFCVEMRMPATAKDRLLGALSILAQETVDWTVPLPEDGTEVPLAALGVPAHHGPEATLASAIYGATQRGPNGGDAELLRARGVLGSMGCTARHSDDGGGVVFTSDGSGDVVALALLVTAILEHSPDLAQQTVSFTWADLPSIPEPGAAYGGGAALCEAWATPRFRVAGEMLETLQDDREYAINYGPAEQFERALEPVSALLQRVAEGGRAYAQAWREAGEPGLAKDYEEYADRAAAPAGSFEDLVNEVVCACALVEEPGTSGRTPQDLARQRRAAPALLRLRNETLLQHPYGRSRGGLRKQLCNSQHGIQQTGNGPAGTRQNPLLAMARHDFEITLDAAVGRVNGAALAEWLAVNDALEPLLTSGPYPLPGGRGRAARRARPGGSEDLWRRRARVLRRSPRLPYGW